MKPPRYEFFSRLAAIINAGESRSVLLCGNVHDLFLVSRPGEHGEFVPLIQFLCEKCRVDRLLLLVYEVNGPIRALSTGDREKLRRAWVNWKAGVDHEDHVLQSLADRRRGKARELLENEFDARLLEAIGRPSVALEFLRQLTICSRSQTPSGRPYIDDNLLVIVEGADLLLPAGDGDISHLNPADRRRVSICQDWFSDPGFLAAADSVVLLAESRSLVHPRVARLPQVLAVEIGAPDAEERRHYISWFLERARAAAAAAPLELWGGVDELARMTAGLSVHALRQLLVGSAHSGVALSQSAVIDRVEEFIRTQLGDDVVEFKKPAHTLDDVIGFRSLKEFIRTELLPRFRASDAAALPGAAVAGAIGSGKTFIFEAVASALDLPVLVLKNIRSQWFGQTDVIFERLRRVLDALVKVVIFVDEADTQFGGVGAETHSTERRLTGKIQGMMSDTRLRGKVTWLLMTARIHLLSPDIRRPGRVGDLIIPVLDPEGEDRKDFLRWVIGAALPKDTGVAATERAEAIERLDHMTEGYSAAAFASLRSHLKAKSVNRSLSIEEIKEIVYDQIQPAIQLTRRYQTLQALINCTRRSLLPDPKITDEEREEWQKEIRSLEALGVR